MYETYYITISALGLDVIVDDLKHHVSKRRDSLDKRTTEPNGMKCFISFNATANIRETMIISFKSIRFHLKKENRK